MEHLAFPILWADLAAAEEATVLVLAAAAAADILVELEEEYTQVSRSLLPGEAAAADPITTDQIRPVLRA